MSRLDQLKSKMNIKIKVHNTWVDRKKAHWKKHIGKKRTGKKRICIISAREKNALGKKRTRINLH